MFEQRRVSWQPLLPGLQMCRCWLLETSSERDALLCSRQDIRGVPLGGAGDLRNGRRQQTPHDALRRHGLPRPSCPCEDGLHDVSVDDLLEGAFGDCLLGRRGGCRQSWRHDSRGPPQLACRSRPKA